jgi:hypothetical protein
MTTVLIRSLSILIFNCKLQEFLIVVILIGSVHLKFLSDAWTLVMLGIWTLHMLVEDVLELIFGGLGHLGTLISHFNILKSPLAIQLSQISIFCCLIRISSIRLLGCVLLNIRLVTIFSAVVNWKDHTLTLLKCKNVSKCVLGYLIYLLIL